LAEKKRLSLPLLVLSLWLMPPSKRLLVGFLMTFLVLLQNRLSLHSALPLVVR
jgi:hypothetical protein